MNVKKLIFASSATALGFGLVGIPAIALADDSPSGDDSPSVASPIRSISTPDLALTQRPTVTQSAGTFTVTAPGVGSLSFSLDPTSDAISGLTVTPAPGADFVAGAPMPIEEGFQVLFTGASGSQFLKVKVDHDGDVAEVKAQVGPAPLAAPAGPAPGPDRHDGGDADHGDADHGNDNGVDNDQDEATTTTVPGTLTNGDHDGMDSHGGDGRQATTTTITALATTGDQSGSSNDGLGGVSSSSPGGSGDRGSARNGSGVSESGSGSSPGGPIGSDSTSGHGSSGSDH